MSDFNIVKKVFNEKFNDKAAIARTVARMDALNDMLSNEIINLKNQLQAVGGFKGDVKSDIIIIQNSINRLVKTTDSYYSFKQQINWGEACDEMYKDFIESFSKVVLITNTDNPVKEVQE
jgi:hypothetical protein